MKDSVLQAEVLERLFTGLEEINCCEAIGQTGEAHVARKCGQPVGAKGTPRQETDASVQQPQENKLPKAHGSWEVPSQLSF